MNKKMDLSNVEKKVDTNLEEARALYRKDAEKALMEEKTKYEKHMNELKIGNQKLESQVEQLKAEHATVV